MASTSWILVAAFVALLGGSASAGVPWKGAALDDMAQQLSSECDLKKDSVACVKFRILSAIEQLFRKESFKVTEDVSVVRNVAAEEAEVPRGNENWVDAALRYVTQHDVVLALPGDSTLTVSPRRLADDQVTATLRFPTNNGRSMEEGRKSKLKRIIIPILVFVLLKAMTLVPLFIGALGLKAWNALQLSFFSFVISVGLAVFQLCKKLASDASGWPPATTVSAHAPWEPTGAGHQVAWGRQIDLDAQNLAYRAHYD